MKLKQSHNKTKISRYITTQLWALQAKEERERGKEVRSPDNDYGRQNQEARHTHLLFKETTTTEWSKENRGFGAKGVGYSHPHPLATLTRSQAEFSKE